MQFSHLVGRVPAAESLYSTRERTRYFPGSAVLAGPGVLVELLVPSRQSSIEVFVDGNVVGLPAVASWLSGLPERARVSIVQGRPLVQRVEAYCSDYRDSCETVVAVGGGSTTDFAKAVISHRVLGGWPATGSDRLFAQLSSAELAQIPFLVAVPTTAGSGAEQSRYFVVYDELTGAKRFGRSWGLVADLVLVAPEILAAAPLTVVVTSAFDAFVHLLEAMLARGEASAWSNAIAADQIPVVMECVGAILAGRGDDAVWVKLGLAATMAGNVISNVRTGLIHEAAGPLTEMLNLTHGEALFACSRACLATVETALPQAVQAMLGRPEVAVFGNTIGDLVDWWERAFAASGLDVRALGAQLEIDPVVRTAVAGAMVGRITSDSVLREKTHPVQLTDEVVSTVVERILSGALSG